MRPGCCGDAGQIIIALHFLLCPPGCSVQEALQAASLHPAQLLGISPKKGKLDYGSDAGQSRLPLYFCLPAVRAAVGPALCAQRFLGC